MRLQTAPTGDRENLKEKNMASTGFRNRIVTGSFYLEGQTFLGQSDSISLLDPEMLSIDERGLGAPGAIERFVGMEKMEISAGFKTIDANILKQFGHMNVREKQYQARYSTVSNDGSTAYGVVECAGRARMVERDDLGVGEDETITTLTIACVQYKETFDGEVIYDFDFENGKIIVDGVNHWDPIYQGL